MVFTGKWKADINNMFYKGEAFLTLDEKDGGYTMDIELPQLDENIGEITVLEAETDDSSFIAKVETSALPGKPIDVNLEFDDDVCSGFIKIPFIGKIKIKDAEKVE